MFQKLREGSQTANKWAGAFMFSSTSSNISSSSPWPVFPFDTPFLQFWGPAATALTGQSLPSSTSLPGQYTFTKPG